MNERIRVIERAAVSYRALADLAETVEDEWQYVTDLTEAYLPAIRALAGSNSGRLLTAEQVVAVDEAIAEIGLIADAHKAIDWLSTFPHVVSLAVGGEVDEPDRSGEPGVDLGTDAPDEDTPFRILRGGDR
ncbi:MAG: hypothetical protein ACHQ01_10765 [Candidatus Limnocylindrales bacterium]